MIEAPASLPHAFWAHRNGGWLALFALVVLLGAPAWAEVAAGGEKPAGVASLVDDKKARQLLEAGDARYEANEIPAALDLYKAVSDRYPASKWRFTAYLKLGKHFLKDKKLDLALDQFRRALAEDNRSADLRGDASLQAGITLFEMQKYQDSFLSLREVVKRFPGTPYCNDAYYYIGQGHFKLGHYAMAIDAFKNVGTSLDATAPEAERLQAGRRLYVQIEDQDFGGADTGAGAEVQVRTTAGDQETVPLVPTTAGAATLMGSVRTQLGEPKPGDGILEVVGGDRIAVTYLDQQTADGKFNVSRGYELRVVGNAQVSVVDGAYAEPVGAAVLGKPAYLLVRDADRDLSAKAETVTAQVRVKRLVEDDDEPAAPPPGTTAPADQAKAEEGKTELTYRLIREQQVVLTEKTEAGPGQPVHTGAFVGSILLAKEGEAAAGALEARVGDLLEIEYLDEVNLAGKPAKVRAGVKLIEGSLNPLKIAQANISDPELRFRTVLKTTETLRNIGDIYKELGLSAQAKDKYRQALDEADQIPLGDAALNQRLLEETYVQLWKTYYAMDDLGRAAQMCLELQRKFPDSPFVGDALFLMAQVSQKKGDFQQAIGVYRQLAALAKSPLAGDAWYGIGECWEALGKNNPALFDQAFVAFKTCFEKHPNSKCAGDALAKMADFYYAKEDFGRAVDIYEEALQQYQDSKFLDVVLFNYGKCLVKMKRLPQASEKFNQLISTYPNSKLVPNARKIAEALEKRAGAAAPAPAPEAK
jgi:TolA-binding protein